MEHVPVAEGIFTCPSDELIGARCTECDTAGVSVLAR